MIQNKHKLHSYEMHLIISLFIVINIDILFYKSSGTLDGLTRNNIFFQMEVAQSSLHLNIKQL